jgi:hypothetical protein
VLQKRKANVIIRVQLNLILNRSWIGRRSLVNGSELQRWDGTRESGVQNNQIDSKKIGITVSIINRSRICYTKIARRKHPREATERTRII